MIDENVVRKLTLLHIANSMQDNSVLFPYFDAAYTALVGKPASNFVFEHGKTPLASFSAGNFMNKSMPVYTLTTLLNSSNSYMLDVFPSHLWHPTLAKG